MGRVPIAPSAHPAQHLPRLPLRNALRRAMLGPVLHVPWRSPSPGAGAPARMRDGCSRRTESRPKLLKRSPPECGKGGFRRPRVRQGRLSPPLRFNTSVSARLRPAYARTVSLRSTAVRCVNPVVVTAGSSAGVAADARSGTIMTTRRQRAPSRRLRAFALLPAFARTNIPLLATGARPSPGVAWRAASEIPVTMRKAGCGGKGCFRDGATARP